MARCVLPVPVPPTKTMFCVQPGSCPHTGTGCALHRLVKWQNRRYPDPWSREIEPGQADNGWRAPVAGPPRPGAVPGASGPQCPPRPPHDLPDRRSDRRLLRKVNSISRLLRNSRKSQLVPFLRGARQQSWGILLLVQDVFAPLAAIASQKGHVSSATDFEDGFFQIEGHDGELLLESELAGGTACLVPVFQLLENMSGDQG